MTSRHTSRTLPLLLRALCVRSSLVLAATACALAATACRQSPQPQPRTLAVDHMIQYGCPTCHVIPGVPGAVGKVGPSLHDISQRSYLAGSLQNTPTNLSAWIQHPQHFQPGTAMPEMGVTPKDADNIVRYLETQ